MPKYSYEAMDNTGNKIINKMYGASKQSVINEIKLQNLFPIKVTLQDEEEVEKASKSLFAPPKIKKKQVATFLRQFASLVRSGMMIMNTLEVLIKEEKNKTFKGILETINSDIMKGDTLSTAMSKHKIFPPMVVSMTAVGEANGKLDASMGRVAKSMENDIKLFAKLKSAMIYPSVLLIVTVLCCAGLTFFVLPVFAKMFEDAGTTLPPLTRALLFISRFATTRWYIVLVITILLIATIFKVLKTPKTRIVIDRFLYRIPVIGPVQNMMMMSSFCRTLSSLLEAGVHVMNSLEIVKSVMNNLYIKSCFEEIVQDVKKGSSISQSISKFDIFTPTVVSSIKIAEESGSIGEVLGRTADLYEDESEAQLQKLSAFLEPAVTVIMAIGVGLIVISIIQPMFQMYTMIGKAK